MKQLIFENSSEYNLIKRFTRFIVRNALHAKTRQTLSETLNDLHETLHGPLETLNGLHKTIPPESHTLFDVVVHLRVRIRIFHTSLIIYDILHTFFVKINLKKILFIFLLKYSNFHPHSAAFCFKQP